MNAQGHTKPNPGQGIAGRIAHAFIDSKLTPLIILASILLGVFATLLLPREEEPQIRVPMIDVLVSMPGFSAKEVEERAVRPMEKLLWEIPGVEYIYSTASEGQCLTIVRFKVGEDVEKSLVKLNQKLQSNFDRIPPGVSHPLIKPKSIDDVPILALTFHSSRYDHYTLRRLVAQVDDVVKQLPQVSETTIIGGARRQVRVLFDPVKLAAYNLSPGMLAQMLQQANRQYRSGELTTQNQAVIVETGGFLRDAEDVRAVVVGVFNNKPVYVRDVAQVVDGPEEPSQYVLFGRGRATLEHTSAPITAPQNGNLPDEEPAVTLAIAKRPGANAIAVAKKVLQKVETLKGYVIPADVQITITRHYGLTAQEKSNELLFHMAIAVFSVSMLILLVLGWREAGIVAIAIPTTLALTLLVFYLYGFTLNRITLFALIFSIGILVDDAIVVVENIVRHFSLPQNRGRNKFDVAVEAVSEVGNPTILATFAVIAAVLPMAFVSGMMGPYMRPIPIGSSAAMFFSLLISFIVTPWAAVRILQWRTHKNATRTAHDSAEPGEGLFARLYRGLMTPLIVSYRKALVFLAALVVLLIAAIATVTIGWVKVKMLPFDNKSEFQIILNMPEGSSLEKTARVAREIAAAVRDEPEVTDYQIYVGVAAPFNFNGLVRHYFMRRGANVADLQINLLPKHERKAQSHDIAKRVRPRVAAIAEKYGARVAVAEVPPGPPVLQTLVAEIYGPTEESRLALAQKMIEIFRNTEGVVDVDWYIESPQPKVRFVIDREKAALHGVSTEAIAATLRMAVGGLPIDIIHKPDEKEDVNIILQLPLEKRTSVDDILSLRVQGMGGMVSPGGLLPLIPLREIVRVEQATIDRSIYHKNLLPVTYVIGDVAGIIESPVYAILKMNQQIKKLDARQVMPGFSGVTNPGTPAALLPSRIKIYNATLPFTDIYPAIKWDGEWQITIEVFRDLGLAFGAVLILIYILMVGWFRSFITPFIVMTVIPFSLIGILPAHGLLGAFFTATSMIGFMAGAGIVVRNSIILVDFIEMRLAQGRPLAEAVIESGLIRFRPIMLTAMAVVVGAAVILFDPIFQGLAISLMAGSVVSMFIAPLTVPLLYYLIYNKQGAKPVSAANQTTNP